MIIRLAAHEAKLSNNPITKGMTVNFSMKNGITSEEKNTIPKFESVSERTLN